MHVMHVEIRIIVNMSIIFYINFLVKIIGPEIMRSVIWSKTEALKHYTGFSLISQTLISKTEPSTCGRLLPLYVAYLLPDHSRILFQTYLNATLFIILGACMCTCECVTGHPTDRNHSNARAQNALAQSIMKMCATSHVHATHMKPQPQHASTLTN